jgi:D-xylose transport system ATP-binding protein
VRLETRALSKSFGAQRALSDISFGVAAGEVHALCGENGAGKSTLIKVVSGIYGEYTGSVLVDGVAQRFAGVKDAERAGIVVIHQELALVPELSAAENIFLGHEYTRFGLLDRARMERESRGLLQRLGCAIDVRAPVRALGVGQAQLVEIARALHKQARVLILDEPTAALSEREVTALFGLLRELVREGVSLVYVSHRLREVFALADRITVLRDGKSVISLRANETNEREVVRHMVGRAIENVFPAREAKPGEVLLSVRDLRAERLSGISFDVRAGEVLGIGGLVGAGRSELLLHLFGAWGKRSGGTVSLLGRPYQQPSPAQSIARGLVLVNEDRKQQGLILEQSVGFNFTLSQLRAFATWGLVHAREERAAQAQLAERVQLRPPRLELAVQALSGGNQQKVVLGRALLSEPRVLLLDEPTRGVDVGAKAEIYALIAALCARGAAVVLVTSELPELLGLADRILMMVDGRIGGEFTRAQASEEALLAAALEPARAS